MIAVLIFFAGAGFCHSQEIPWEKNDIKNPETAYVAEPDSCPGAAEAVLGLLLDIYKKGQSDRTVSRCPFYSSCSQFLMTAVDRYGFPLGMLAFIDRYFYRENRFAFQKYSLRRRQNGVYKLDDEYYLEKKSKSRKK